MADIVQLKGMIKPPRETALMVTCLSQILHGSDGSFKETMAGRASDWVAVIQQFTSEAETVPVEAARFARFETAV